VGGAGASGGSGGAGRGLPGGAAGRQLRDDVARLASLEQAEQPATWPGPLDDERAGRAVKEAITREGLQGLTVDAWAFLQGCAEAHLRDLLADASDFATHRLDLARLGHGAGGSADGWGGGVGPGNDGEGGGWGPDGGVLLGPRLEQGATKVQGRVEADRKRREATTDVAEALAETRIKRGKKAGAAKAAKDLDEARRKAAIAQGGREAEARAAAEQRRVTAGRTALGAMLDAGARGWGTGGGEGAGGSGATTGPTGPAPTSTAVMPSAPPVALAAANPATTADPAAAGANPATATSADPAADASARAADHAASHLVGEHRLEVSDLAAALTRDARYASTPRLAALRRMAGKAREGGGGLM